jgi:hypothetical protein
MADISWPARGVLREGQNRAEDREGRLFFVKLTELARHLLPVLPCPRVNIGPLTKRVDCDGLERRRRGWVGTEAYGVRVARGYHDATMISAAPKATRDASITAHSNQSTAIHPLRHLVVKSSRSWSVSSPRGAGPSCHRSGASTWGPLPEGAGREASHP